MKSGVKYIFLGSGILSKLIMTWNYYYQHVQISRLELKETSFLHHFMQFIEIKNKPCNSHLILFSTLAGKQYFNEVTPLVDMTTRNGSSPWVALRPPTILGPET
jgi:hypothetical protein